MAKSFSCASTAAFQFVLFMASSLVMSVEARAEDVKTPPVIEASKVEGVTDPKGSLAKGGSARRKRNAKREEEEKREPVSEPEATTTWTDQMREIMTKVKSGQRADLVDVQTKLARQIQAKEKDDSSDETSNQFRAQKDLLSAAISDSSATLNRVQSALRSAATSSDVRKLIEDKKPATKSVTESLKGEAFDVKVTYELEGEGNEAVLKRAVELVPKASSELKASSNPAIKEIASDVRFEPVLKQAVDAMVDQVEAPLKSEGFLTENSQKLSDIKDGVPAVETKLSAGADKMKTKLEEAEANLDVDLANAEAKRDIAAQDKQAEVQRLEGQRMLAEWAVKNSGEAKGLDECGLTKKALELNSKLEFDMLDAGVQKKCAKIKEEAEKGADRPALSAADFRAAGQPGAVAPTAEQAAQEQAKQIAIQKFMEVVASCMVDNTRAVDAVKKLEDLIKPSYEAIKGYDDVEKMISSSTFAGVVLGNMMSEGEDPESAALLAWNDAKTVYPNSDEGNSALHVEMSKLYRLRSKLSLLLNEYSRRSEEMARQVADQEAKGFMDLVAAAQAGNPAAQAEFARRQQAGLPVTPQDVHRVAYDAQIKTRQQDTKHLQMKGYADAVGSSFSRLSSAYNTRREQWESGNNTWVVGGSSAASAASKLISGSSTLRSVPGVAVDNSLAGGSVTQVNSGGALRSTGGAAGATVRQPAATGTVRRSGNGALR